jgi:hypothetical protein
MARLNMSIPVCRKARGQAYRVRTYNDAGESAYSNIVQVMVLG